MTGFEQKQRAHSPQLIKAQRRLARLWRAYSPLENPVIRGCRVLQSVKLWFDFTGKWEGVIPGWKIMKKAVDIELRCIIGNPFKPHV